VVAWSIVAVCVNMTPMRTIFALINIKTCEVVVEILPARSTGTVESKTFTLVVLLTIRLMTLKFNDVMTELFSSVTGIDSKSTFINVTTMRSISKHRVVVSTTTMAFI